VTPDLNETREPRILWAKDDTGRWWVVGGEGIRELLGSGFGDFYVSDSEGFRRATQEQVDARLAWRSPDAGDAR
jgi:hypothetical protein